MASADETTSLLAPTCKLSLMEQGPSCNPPIE